MEPISSLVLTAAITSIITGSVGYAFWTKKQKVNDQRELDQRVQQLESAIIKFVTEPKVRDIISEEVKFIREDNAAIKGQLSGLSELISSLKTELAVLNYIKDTNHKQE